jgi:uncharacterized membrane protein
MAKPKIPDAFSKEKVLFFKVPLIFQTYQSTLTQAEKDIYIYFLIQMKYKKSKWIRTSNVEIGYWTGIHTKATIGKAIKGLVEIGFIGDIKYQKNNANIYCINITPVVNENLAVVVAERSRAASERKKRSIANGETGKFISKNDGEGNIVP